MDRNVPASEVSHIPLDEGAENQLVSPMVTAQPVVAAQPVAQPYVQQPYGARGYEQQAHYGQPVVAQPVAGPGPPGPGPVGPDGRRPTWSSGICDCFMQCSPSCLMGFFCPCFQFARIKKTENIEGCPGDSWGLNCCCYFIVSFLSGLLPSNLLLFILGVIGTIGRTWMLATLRLHYRMRRMYEGSQLEDVICALCCAPCVLSQMAREVYQYDGSCDCNQCGQEFMPPPV
mmetsp:Transcript_14888/g.29247  ORF Transcript_14888/g.29247 Transcript_14888/m.29247 type:complete len:230 (+) Transcript_14888:74-763(+)|eukprot:CAMPEP_0167810562 /NCGR_PEP_ID=MMETSP0112_2-20121227/156_1 /TAXON_ID=91324 /ORGANISM="Lotharella globosa, Strain CCCM811" /LENGTH=229 /DNA_ID=CAMNT_0007709125 /DNA_START=38 /DNA_END=727 /DNA_ORIENTATION=+